MGHPVQVRRHQEIQACVTEEAAWPGLSATENLMHWRALCVCVLPGEDRPPLNILAHHLSLWYPSAWDACTPTIRITLWSESVKTLVECKQFLKGVCDINLLH